MKTFPETELLRDRVRGDVFLDLIGRYTEKPTFKIHLPGGAREFYTRCPLGCGSKHDALILWPDELPKPMWWCRRCDASGDIFQFVQEMEHIPFKRAVRRVADLVSMPTTYHTFQHRKSEADSSISYIDIDMTRWQAEAGVFVKAGNDRLLSPVGKPTREMLYKRGINDMTIRQARLGYLDKYRDQLPDKWGIPSIHKIVPGLIIPYLDAGGTVEAIKIRTDLPHPKKWVQVFRGGGYLPPYGTYTINQGAIVIIQESEIDAMLGKQFNPNYGWVALSAGQHLRPSALPENCTLILALDNDLAGRNATARLKEAWPEAVIAPPFDDGIKDLSELYKAKGPEAVNRWIAETIDSAVESVAF